MSDRVIYWASAAVGMVCAFMLAVVWIVDPSPVRIATWIVLLAWAAIVGDSARSRIKKQSSRGTE